MPNPRALEGAGTALNGATPSLRCSSWSEALRPTSGRGARVKANRPQRERVNGAGAGEEPADAMPDAM
jgi:hypothetical protein